MSENPLVSVPSVEDMLNAINETRARMETDEEFRKELEEGPLSGNPMTLGPRLPTADEWTNLQVQGAQNNAEKWLSRTTKPKKNFKEEALKKTSIDRYKDSMNKVISQGRWEGGMDLVDESETMAIITAGGSGIYSSGVSRRKDKIKRRVTELREDRLALCSTVDTMPVATDAEREAKMLANKRGLQAIGAKRRGG